MSAGTDNVAVFGHALSVAVHGGFAAYLITSSRLQGSSKLLGRLLVAALLATVSWSVAEIGTSNWPSPTWAFLGQIFDVGRYGLWFAFLMQLFPADVEGGKGQAVKVLRLSAGIIVAAAVGALVWRGAGDFGATTARPALVTALALPMLGLLIVEQVFRNVGEASRWGAKPVCLGLACVFAFDTYVFSEGLLFGQTDPDAYSLRGAAHALAVPFLFVAARRRNDWITRLQVSRTAAFYSATLILAGAYLLFMSGIGYYVRYFGGTWGRALQLGLLVVGLAFLVALVVSGSLRSWLKVFVGKHFYSYRYDYREEWLRFTAMLSSKRSPEETGGMIVRGLAKMVECPAGSLWARNGTDQPYAQAAVWNMPRVTQVEPVDSPFSLFMRDKGWVIDLEEFRSAPRRYAGLTLPTWLLGSPNPWLVVPLLVGDDMLGFVLLARPRTSMDLNWEVLDLLKTAGRQAAGYLAQMQATEALLEARKFEAFNRMSAFVVHDLKNIVTQLSLMLKNAERLHDNREFQQDMLLTVESSLEKMKRLMLQLREGATPPGGSRGVEIGPIVRRLVSTMHQQGRKLETQESEPLSTRGHDDRLERVLGHLVQNAMDATPATGRVWLKVQRFSGQVMVEVGDTGAGMSEEFVQTKLFRPFNTTKHSGMGIGTYESFQYIRELGGSVSVDSRLSEGTVLTVLLPLFEAQRGSDLLRPSAA
jgi:putative PEP-CTERM system histidine kinase